MNNVKTKFNVGDEVVVVKSNEKGIIKEIQSYLGVGDNVYVVNVDGSERLYVESLLSFDGENDVMKEIDDKVASIIKELELNNKSDDKEANLTTICKLQKYLVTRNDEVLESKIVNINNVVVNELYHGLINGKSNNISNTYVFSKILSKLGFDVLNVGCNDEDETFYMTNMVLIDNEYYYFDVTLDQEIYREKGLTEDELFLCSAGLGSEEYEQFFTPLCTLDNGSSITKDVMPTNVATTSMDEIYLNKLIGIDYE